MIQVGAGSKRCEPRGRSVLIAAFREGLGLAAVSVTRAPGGTRISAVREGSGASAEDAIEARWWCRRAADAERLAAAAMRRLQRREIGDRASPAASDSVSPCGSGHSAEALARADEAIAGAAKRLNITLLSGEEVAAEAMAVIARVDEEVERLQRSGELKSVNKSYRAYRIEASARGEKALRYDEWMGKYRENMVRLLAAALRYV